MVLTCLGLQYGLKNGDKLHLVKKLGEAGVDEAGDAGPSIKVTGSQEENDIITVIVPQGARAGAALTINPPGRETMRVTVPSGLRPGERFRVRIPPRSGAPGQQQQPSAGPGQIMQVRCPQNARSGQQIEVSLFLFLSLDEIFLYSLVLPSFLAMPHRYKFQDAVA